MNESLIAPDASSASTSHAGTRARGFPVSTAELERVTGAVLAAAQKGGATAAEAEVSQGMGQSVTVRHGEIETITYNRDKGVSVSVYVGQRRGHASTADFSDAAIRDTVDKALAIARYTAEDPAAGLADPARFARTLAGPRPVSPVGPRGRSRPSSWAARRSARRSPSTSASPTPRAPRSRAANRNSSTPTRRDSSAAIAARATTSIAR